MHQHSQNTNFKSLLNFRDIGGMPASGKSRIKEGIVFRSANPDKLNRHDNEMLRSLNIKTIIDLRAPIEITKRSNPLDNSEKISLPLDFQQTTRERMRPFIYKKDSQDIIAEISNALYLEILDASAQALSQVMEILATSGRSPF